MTAFSLRHEALENALIRLEPLEERHRALLRPLADDTDIWRFMTVRGDGAHFDPLFDRVLAGPARGDEFGFAQIERQSGTVIGHTAFAAYAPQHFRVEIGLTFLSPNARGRGLNAAAKHLLISHALTCGAKRVELKTHGANHLSQRAMEKLGFVREGLFRDHMQIWTGEQRDTVYYSILPSDWPDIDAKIRAAITRQGGEI